MNSTAQYIIYGSDEALRKNDPACGYTCISLSQALAAAHSLQVNPATHITLPHTAHYAVLFNNLEELCADLLRSRARRFSIKLDDHMGTSEVVASGLNRSELFSWILDHAHEFDMMSYNLNYETMKGNYTIGNLVGTYFIQECYTE